MRSLVIKTIFTIAIGYVCLLTVRALAEGWVANTEAAFRAAGLN